MEKVPQAGFEIVGLDIVGFNRSNLLANLSLPGKLLKSRNAARKIIDRFKPDVIVGVGGYASYPMLSAGQAARIPTLIQEQNSYAGKSNKMLANRAKAICVAYDNMSRFFPASAILFTGNPVRELITGMNGNSNDCKLKFGLQPGKKTILVVGGSQGAKSINEAVSACLEKWVADGLQIIWQTGKAYFETAAGSAVKYQNSVFVKDFITGMDDAYTAADIVVSRAGALAIAELCIAARPVIFVPYPFAAENHQWSNAQALVDKGAALIINDNEINDKLYNTVSALANNAQQMTAMSQELGKMAIRDADERIANKIFEIAGK